MNKYEVWNEGFATSGESGNAQRLTIEGEDTLWEGETFIDACKNALKTLGWDMSYYDEKGNRYWGCDFYDNETDARKFFG